MHSSGTLALGLRLYMQFSAHDIVPPLTVTMEAVNVLLLFGWIFSFTPEWVMVVARKYAERLLKPSTQCSAATVEGWRAEIGTRRVLRPKWDRPDLALGGGSGGRVRFSNYA
jgi:hypothetical protein